MVLTKIQFIDQLKSHHAPSGGGKLMAENKFVVKTVFHDENGDTLLREDYRETREKAQELKDLADFGYSGLFGKGQTKVTTEIIER
jgi:hypothetical protein